MADNPPVPNKDESEIESLKKTTRIFLDETLGTKPASKKATTSLIDRANAEKKTTGPIMGIPTHAAPIPQTIRLKRPSTSPIVISTADLATTPTVAKVVPSKGSTSRVIEGATVIKKPELPRPLNETSRIILDLSPPSVDLRPKTAPLPSILSSEPTPAGPKTIRLKRPSAVIAVTPTEEKQVAPPVSPPAVEVEKPMPAAPEETRDLQPIKKSETAKIELPTGAEYQTPVTQRKTIKIKRTDRNVIARTVTLTRPAEAKPPVEVAAPQKEEPVQKAPVQEEPLLVFPILAGVTVICLALLVYLLTSQAFGPELLLPVPPFLF
jgi:hypothetical protein